MNQGDVLTEEDRAKLVEIIQRATAGMSESQKLHVAENWIWMGRELIRAVAFARSQ
jgi:hypothetical protein